MLVGDMRVRRTGRDCGRVYLEVSPAGGKRQLETVGRSLLDPDLDANATSGTALPLADWRPESCAEALASFGSLAAW